PDRVLRDHRSTHGAAAARQHRGDGLVADGGAGGEAGHRQRAAAGVSLLASVAVPGAGVADARLKLLFGQGCRPPMLSAVLSTVCPRRDVVRPARERIRLFAIMRIWTRLRVTSHTTTSPASASSLTPREASTAKPTARRTK